MFKLTTTTTTVPCLRNKPRLTYKGLTLILSNQSRLDNVSLLSGTGGLLVSDHCLRPEYNRLQCDIRLAEDKSPFLPDTKCLVLFGEWAMHHWLPETRGNSLAEMRGSVFNYNGIPAIPTFYPQDAADRSFIERRLNPLSKEYVIDAEESWDDDNADEGDIKRYGRTKRSNYAFWIRNDIKKAKTILSSGLPKPHQQPTYRLYPSSDEVIQVLSKTKGGWLDFDMETDYEEQNLQCFSFTFDGSTIYCVPVLDYNYKPAYSALYRIMQALAIAIRDNTLVAHNGQTFDFFVLGYKYHIPVYKVYDTMIAQHRIFPDIEKSLGHCVSYWTWEHFHKDTDSKGYLTKEQMMARLLYCGKDVYTMCLVRKAQQSYAKTIPGLEHSIETAQAAVRPYIIAMIQGIRYDKAALDKLILTNDRLMMQYLRMLKILIGEEGIRQIRTFIKGKAKAFPGSNTQCVAYFHHLLGYPPVARSLKTQKPSLGKKAMYKLRLKYDNPVIDFVMAYRRVQKETSTLKFVAWKDDNNVLYKEPTDSAKATLFPV